MIKNIIIGVLALLTVLSSLFGFVEHAEANRQREIAIENAEQAIASKRMAEEQMQMAARPQKEAEQQYSRAMECCNKK